MQQIILALFLISGFGCKHTSEAVQVKAVEGLAVQGQVQISTSLRMCQLEFGFFDDDTPETSSLLVPSDGCGKAHIETFAVEEENDFYGTLKLCLAEGNITSGQFEHSRTSQQTSYVSVDANSGTFHFSPDESSPMERVVGRVDCREQIDYGFYFLRLTDNGGNRLDPPEVFVLHANSTSRESHLGNPIWTNGRARACVKGDVAAAIENGNQSPYVTENDEVFPLQPAHRDGQQGILLRTSTGEAFIAPCQSE